MPKKPGRGKASQKVYSVYKKIRSRFLKEPELGYNQRVKQVLKRDRKEIKK